MVFEMTSPVSNVEASVVCEQSGPFSGTVQTTVENGISVRVAMEPALPDGDCCDITLNGDSTDIFRVRTLRGDTNRDGTVSSGDASIIKPHFGESTTDENAHFDYNVDGIITTADYALIKPLFGNSVPLCP